MDKRHIQPNAITYSYLVTACTECNDTTKGRLIHSRVMAERVELTPKLASLLLKMYCKFKDLAEAESIFTHHQKHLDIFSWTTMISTYAQCGRPRDAIRLFEQLTRDNLQPTSVTYTCVLSACSALKDLTLGKRLHEEIGKNSIPSTLELSNALIGMYSKCGEDHAAFQIYECIKRSNMTPNYYTFKSLLPACNSLELAHQIHQEMLQNKILLDVSLQTALIDMYGRCGDLSTALNLFENSKQTIQPDEITYVCLFTACANQADLKTGKKLHAEFEKSGLKLSQVVLGALVNLYVKCGNVRYAVKMVEESKVEPNEEIFSILLLGCADQTLIQTGIQVHQSMISKKFKITPHIQVALISFYGKCGRKDIAETVISDLLNTSTPQTVSIWNSILAVYAHNGMGREALKLFNNMTEGSFLPDEVTFTVLLNACSHSRLCDEAVKLFSLMQTKFNITPSVKHYNCMIDVMSRVGDFEAAEKYIKEMKFPDAISWTTLQGAARSFRNVDRARYYTEQLEKHNLMRPGNYVLLGNTYAHVGQFDKAEEVRKWMELKGVKKIPGISCIEVNYERHCFVAGDHSHPQSKQIYAKLDELNDQMIAAGFKPDTSWVLQNVAEHEKMRVLCYHR